MSLRRLNYTGRKRIAREDVRIGLEGLPPIARLVAGYDLASYAFPATARVVVEAQAGWTVQQFELGTVGVPTHPDDCVLSDFSSLAGILFRLKIVATGDHDGRILGEADKLHPSGSVADASQRSFVVVRPTDLGQVPWSLEFDENQPLLLVNSRLGDHHEFLRRKEVLALVLPAVLKGVLSEALAVGADEEGGSSWHTQALRFGERLAGTSPPVAEDDDARDRWTHDAVNAFARHHRLLEGLLGTIEGDD